VARVFITGSSDGLGLMAAKLLIEQGHEVVLHGRNDDRSRDALTAAPGAQGAISGDFSTIAGATTVAREVNRLGHFDAVIHNAGIGHETRRVETEPGVPSIFAVNVLAPPPPAVSKLQHLDRDERQRCYRSPPLGAPPCKMRVHGLPAGFDR